LELLQVPLVLLVLLLLLGLANPVEHL